MNNKITRPSDDASKVITFGMSVIIIVFVIFGGWMAIAPLSTFAVAAGQVSADLEKKVIQHLEGGIVEKIYVKDGDKVKKGEKLLKLDELQIKASLEIFQSQLQDALAVYARTKALEENAAKVIFPDELTNDAVKRNQINIFETQKKSLNDEKAISKNRVIQSQNQIDGIISVLNSKTQRLDSITEEIKEWEELLKQQLVDKVKIRDLKREKNQLIGDIANLNSEVAKTKEQIEEIKLQQLLREKDFKKTNLDQMVQAKSQIEDLRSKIEATKDRLTRTDIIAPIAGTVVGLKIHTEGAVIRPGDPILEVVPDNSKLLVIARVQVTDIDKVKVGLLADIRFSAFNTKTAHVIEGKVIHVSADSFSDDQSQTNYYEAKIELTKKGMEDLKGYGFILVSGMPAEVMINIGERTALSYFVKPFMDMLSRGFNEE
jgi:epimerase transport system membrane fusion protein